MCNKYTYTAYKAYFLNVCTLEDIFLIDDILHTDLVSIVASGSLTMEVEVTPEMCCYLCKDDMWSQWWKPIRH